MKTKTPKTPAEMRAMLREQNRRDIEAAVRAGTATISEAVQLGNQRMDAIDARLDALEANTSRQNLPGSAEERSEDGEPFNFGKVLRSLVLKNANEPEARWRAAAPMEWEMHDQLRAQGVSPDNLGGFLVPGEVLIDQIIPKLRPRLIATLLGATEADFISAPVDIPREVTDPVTEALAENETQTASDAEIGNMRLEPHRAQAYIEASRRLFSMGPGASTIITNMMTKKMATTINGWALNGTGGKQPTGVVNTVGIGSVSFSGITLDSSGVDTAFYLRAQEFEEALADADALEGAGKLAWAMPTKVKRAFRSIKSDSGTAGETLQVEPGSVYDAASKEILGYPFATSTQLAGGSEAELIFGDWETLIMATFGNMVLETSNVAGEAMRQGQTHIVAAMEVDTAVTQPGAFAISSALDVSSF